MSRNLDESDQRSQQDLFRNLISDSKLVFLSRAIDQYEQAQLYLRQHEDHQRRVKQFMEYNRIKLIELDLARQRILQACMNGSGIGSPRIPNPPDKPEGAPRPRASTKNLLPLQRPSQPTAQFKTYEQRMASLTTQSDSLKPKGILDNVLLQKNEGFAIGSHETSSYSTSEDGYSEKAPTDQKINVPRWRNSSCFKDADVLFERGNFTYNHPGNRVYREYIKTLQDEYVRSKKNDKVSVATKVLHFIKNTCGGRFMACDKEGSGNWGELSDDAARRKIGQSLREKNKRYMPPPRSRKNGKRNKIDG